MRTLADHAIESNPVRRQFEADLGTPFHVKIDELEIRMKTTLVGLERDDYLIITLPRIHHMGNVSSLFPKGKAILVRYGYKGSVYGFTSSILGTVFSPRRLMFLEYPESVEIQNYRAHERYDCLFPVSIRNDGGIARGSVTDIGKGGCRIEVDLAQGDGVLGFERVHSRIHLDVKLPWGSRVLEVDAVLRHMNNDGERMVCGMEFERLKEAEQEELSEFILEVGSFS